MNLTILAVGEHKSSPEQALVNDYCKRFVRLARPLGLSGIDQIIVKSGSGLDREGERLLAKIPSGARTIRLDEHGTPASSTALADRLAKWRDTGTRSTVFLIGGAEGYSQPVRQAVPEAMAFGLQTWPHLLVRVMLAEQLYRAANILAGTPYHKA